MLHFSRRVTTPPHHQSVPQTHLYRSVFVESMLKESDIAHSGRHELIARRGHFVLMALTVAAVGAILLCLGQSESHADSFEHRALVSEHSQNYKLHVSGISLRSNGRIFTDLKLNLKSKILNLNPILSKPNSRKKSRLSPDERKRRQRRCRRRCRQKHPGRSAASRKARRNCRKQKCGNGDSGEYDDEPAIAPQENFDTETAEDKEDDQVWSFMSSSGLVGNWTFYLLFHNTFYMRLAV
jgi:hypothetical protein